MPPVTTVDILRRASPTISVGVLSADLMALGAQLALLEEAGVRVAHVDVMDGCFTPMMTVGAPFIKALKTPLLKDAHLMVEEPVAKLGDYAAAGADVITVHVESTRHVHRALQQLGGMENANDPARGIVRGAALNPGTPLTAIAPLLDEIDMIVLLAVNPGWSGQRFIPATERRIAQARKLIASSGRDLLLCVDGGVTRDNIAQVAKMGADLIVTGSAVFDGKSPLDNARFMLEACRSARGTD
jgi:ribulose-phosphate 3-epimerase